MSLSQFQDQLVKFEQLGLLISRNEENLDVKVKVNAYNRRNDINRDYVLQLAEAIRDLGEMDPARFSSLKILHSQIFVASNRLEIGNFSTLTSSPLWGFR